MSRLLLQPNLCEERRQSGSNKVGKKKSKRCRTGISVSSAKPSSDPFNRDTAASLRAQISSSGGPLLALQSDTDELHADATQKSMRRMSDEERVVVLITGKAVMSSNRPEHQAADFRSGARKGKVKHKAVDMIGTTYNEATMSIQDMLRAEKEQNHSMLDEIYARNVALMDSRFKAPSSRQVVWQKRTKMTSMWMSRSFKNKIVQRLLGRGAKPHGNLQNMTDRVLLRSSVGGEWKVRRFGSICLLLGEIMLQQS